MLNTSLVLKTLERLKFADLRQLAQENGLHIHSKMTKKELIRDLLWTRPRPFSLKLYGGARTESPSTEKSPPIEWDKIPEPALQSIIKRLSRNDFNRFRRTSKKFNDRIKNLETKDFYKELIAKLPYVPYVPIILKASSKVRSVAWSPDGTRLASGEDDKIIRIWKFDPNTETFQQEPLELRGHTNLVLSVAWSPDGTRLASGGFESVIRIWKFDPNTETFQQKSLELKAHTFSSHSVAWSPDGTRLASGGGDMIILIWNFDPNTETFQQKPTELKSYTSPRRISVNSVAWSPDGTRLASGEDGGIIRIWKFYPKTETFIQKLHQFFVKSLELKGGYNYIHSVAWSPDGTRLASGGDGIIQIWEFDPNTETFKTKPLLRGHANSVWSVAWSPDGTRLASGGHDKIIRIWEFDPNTETFKKKPLELKGHTNVVLSVAWSPDGTRLASGGHDRKILIWTS